MSQPATLRRLVDRPNPYGLVLLAALLVGLLVVGALAVAPAAGAASVQDDANESGNDTANDTAPAELQPIDVANASGNDTEPVTLEGEGQTVTDSVALEDGLLVVAYDHEGESNFQVDLWNDSADERAAYVVNQIGAVNGTTAVPVTAGNYSLDVNADGAWNVTLVQPNTTAVVAAQADNDTEANGSDGNETGDDGDANETDGGEANATIASPPATASGEGPTVLGPVAFEDSVTVTANHSGESNFQVELYRENATSLSGWTLAFNEIGQLEGAEARVDHAGLTWIVVTADGEWDLRFEES